MRCLVVSDLSRRSNPSASPAAPSRFNRAIVKVRISHGRSRADAHRTQAHAEANVLAVAERALYAPSSSHPISTRARPPVPTRSAAVTLMLPRSIATVMPRRLLTMNGTR